MLNLWFSSHRRLLSLLRRSGLLGSLLRAKVHLAQYLDEIWLVDAGMKKNNYFKRTRYKFLDKLLILFNRLMGQNSFEFIVKFYVK